MQQYYVTGLMLQYYRIASGCHMSELFFSFNTVAALGDELRRLRLDAGLTQAELAERAGVSRRWIGAAEKGYVGGEMGNLMMVVRALGMKLVFERDPWAG